MPKPVIVVALLALGLAALGWAVMRPGAAPLEQPDTAAPALKDDQMTADLATAFPGAPADVTAIAGQIMQGDVPQESALMALGREQLNRSWSQPFAKTYPDAGHTLLRQAVVSMNLVAAAALIKSGADPFYNSNEMPFQAVRMSTNVERVWYPDYALGTAFVMLWLQSDGDPNAICPLWSGGPILYSLPPDNLEASIALIKAGADPWFNPSPPDDQTYFYDNFFELQANATVMSNELAFRLAREGLYRGADRDKAAALIATYQAVAEEYKTATGPEDLRSVWGMQRALAEILPQLDIGLDGAIAQMMAIDIPPDIGGFFLAEGEIRSPADPDQLVTTDTQWGSERWGD